MGKWIDLDQAVDIHATAATILDFHWKFPAAYTIFPFYFNPLPYTNSSNVLVLFILSPFCINCHGTSECNYFEEAENLMSCVDCPASGNVMPPLDSMGLFHFLSNIPTINP